MLRQKTFSTKLIGVGNLSMGGTGKSVVVDYLIKHLSPKENVGVLSRGYRRHTKGLILANTNETPYTIGDEPYQFYSKYPHISLAVSENRAKGIAALEKRTVQTILLDDVYQHRWVQAKPMILTTTYQNPYFKDFIFPVGHLREIARGSRRAHIILVTKCPKELSYKIKKIFIKKLNPKPSQKVYFTRLSYPKHVFDYQKNWYPIKQLKHQKIKLITGIVDPDPLIQYLKDLKLNVESIRFPDHHHYSKSDFSKISLEKASIITTEKDFYKLIKVIDPKKVFCISVTLEFLNATDEVDFLNQVISPKY